MATPEKDTRSADPAALAVLKTATDTAYDRHLEQEPRCGFGELGVCCRICEMGPCRVDPFEHGQGAKRGV